MRNYKCFITLRQFTDFTHCSITFYFPKNLTKCGEVKPVPN